MCDIKLLNIEIFEFVSVCAIKTKMSFFVLTMGP